MRESIQSDDIMRDPWFPIASFLAVALLLVFGIVGPVPPVVTSWIMAWQNLIAAAIASTVASAAAYVAFNNTTRTLKHSENQEKHRRSRKHKAVRASFPLAIAQITQYAEDSARRLNELIGKCDHHEVLPTFTAPDDLASDLPADTLKIITEFIEYSDDIETRLLEATIAAIQVHDARLRGVVETNRDPNEEDAVLRHELDGLVVDAAAIYAGASVHFDYGRGYAEEIPKILPWSAVGAALRNLRFWEENYPRLQAILTNRAKLSVGPFEKKRIADILLDQ